MALPTISLEWGNTPLSTTDFANKSLSNLINPALNTDLVVNTFTLSEVGNLRFADTLGAGTPLKNNIYTDPLNGKFNIQSIAGDEIQFLEGDNILTDVYASLSKTLTDFSIQASHETRLRDARVLGISQFDGDMKLTTVSGSGNPNFSPTVNVTLPNDGGDLGTSSLPWEQSQCKTN